MIRRNILIAEDRELLRAMEHSFFHRSGFHLLTATSGREAFLLVEEEDPLLVILDLDMPELTGDACCRRIKVDPFLRTTPVLLAARCGVEQDLQRCRAAGCDEVLTRPINSQQLLAAACRLLRIIDRAQQRPATCFNVRCGADPRKLRSGCARNLNSGGMFIETTGLLPVGTPLTLEFTLPGSSAAIRCRGRVAWVNHPEWLKSYLLPSGMGVQFLELAAEAQAAVEEYCRQVLGGGQETGTGHSAGRESLRAKG